MDFILNTEQMNDEHLLQASIYLDACFILTFLDKTDSRKLDVADALDLWAEKGVKIGYSNHTFTEVTNRLFQMLVLGSLQVYHENKELINKTRNGYDKLSDKQKQKLLDLESAKFLYQVAKKEDILRLYKKEVAPNVGELMKFAKKNEDKRHLLDVYYQKAFDIFNQLIHDLREEMGFEVELLSCDFNIYHLARMHMQLTQLDPTDSVHLGIARHHQYDFLATLDSDFVHNFYSKVNGLSLRIYKVA